MNLRIFYQKNKTILDTILYIAIISMGIIFIINNAILLKVSFIITGSLIILIAIYMFVSLMQAGKNRSGEALAGSYFRLFLIVMIGLGGLSIIISASQNTAFYPEILASIFFFRAIHRLFYAYLYKKSGRNNASTILLILSIIGFAFAAFLTFYTGSSKVVGIISGCVVILEGLYGLYRIWAVRIIKKLRGSKIIKNSYTQGSNNYSNGYSKNGDGEIVITDYEIVENDITKE